MGALQWSVNMELMQLRSYTARSDYMTTMSRFALFHWIPQLISELNSLLLKFYWSIDIRSLLTCQSFLCIQSSMHVQFMLWGLPVLVLSMANCSVPIRCPGTWQVYRM